ASVGRGAGDHAAAHSVAVFDWRSGAVAVAAAATAGRERDRDLFHAGAELRMDSFSDPHVVSALVQVLPATVAQPSPAPFQEREVLVRRDDALRRPIARYATGGERYAEVGDLLDAGGRDGVSRGWELGVRG